MTWVRLDDGFFRHPKARAASKDGRALFVASLCWSAANLTDGHIRDESVTQILADAEAKKNAVDRLAAAGLWHPGLDEGWDIHDYLEFNKSRADVMKERDRWRRSKAKLSPGNGHAVCGNPRESCGTPRWSLAAPFPFLKTKTFSLKTCSRYSQLAHAREARFGS
jgi:hypothetical protein